MHKDAINLDGKFISDDPAMQKVIDAQSKIKELDRQNKALRADREQLLAEYTDIRNARPIKLQPQKSKTPERTDKIRVCFGDMHGMRMDKAAVQALLSDIEVLNPDEIVIGGDMLECGGWLAKHQPIGFVALSDYSYQEDVQATNEFLDCLQDAAPNAEIHYLEGNHEDRVERWCVDQTMAHGRDAEFLRTSFAPQFVLRLAERGIKYYRRSEVYVEGLPRGWIKLDKMYFTHQLTGGKNAASRAISRTAGNVTYFHTHQEDSSTSVFPSVGLVKAFCPGCLCDMQPVWRHSEPSNWSQGYGIDIISESGNFQRIHVPIWRGSSLAKTMIERFSGT